MANVKKYVVKLSETELNIIKSLSTIYQDNLENDNYKFDKRLVKRLPINAIAEQTGYIPKTVTNTIKNFQNLQIKGVA